MKLAKVRFETDWKKNAIYDHSEYPLKERQRSFDQWVLYVMEQLMDAGICNKKEASKFSIHYDGSVDIGVRDSEGNLATVYKGLAWSEFDKDKHLPKTNRDRQVLANEFGAVWLSIGGSHHKFKQVVDTANKLGLEWSQAGAAEIGSKRRIFCVPKEDVMLWLDHVPTVTVYQWYQKRLKEKAKEDANKKRS